MSEAISILDAEYVSGYKISIYFSDGSYRQVDFEAFLNAAKHPVTRSYLDLEKFRHFHVINGNLDWNDFEFCVPVHQLYDGRVTHS